MIQQETRLKVADNTGAKEILCIKVLGGSRRKYARTGDLIVISVKKTIPGSSIKKERCIKLLLLELKKNVSVKMDLILDLMIMLLY